MTPRQALLAAVLASPDDDAPRLVYADWLDENGEPERAEFVRVQCEYARRFNVEFVGHECDHPDCKYCTLRRRGQQLQLAGRNAVLWRGALLNLLPAGGSEFRRGFIESITCDAIDWHAHANAIRAEHPVREVTLTTWPDSDGYFLPDGEPATMVAVGGKNEYVCARWPGITFHLPDLQQRSTYDEWEALYQAARRVLGLAEDDGHDSTVEFTYRT